jgi:esterase/lipase
VAKQLRENGHTVYTPTLSGLAERSHLLNMGVNLTTHIHAAHDQPPLQTLRS